MTNEKFFFAGNGGGSVLLVCGGGFGEDADSRGGVQHSLMVFAHKMLSTANYSLIKCDNLT